MIIREQTFDDVCDAVAGEALHAERVLLSAGWLAPVTLNNAGYRQQRGGQHFADPVHSFTYCYLCQCAELARTPTLAECSDLANEIGISTGQCP